jgi:hypothetical protein
MIAGSPLEDLDRPNEPVDRDRLLSDKKLVAIYGAAQKVGYPFGSHHSYSLRWRGEVGARFC